MDIEINETNKNIVPITIYYKTTFGFTLTLTANGEPYIIKPDDKIYFSVKNKADYREDYLLRKDLVKISDNKVSLSFAEEDSVTVGGGNKAYDVTIDSPTLNIRKKLIDPSKFVIKGAVGNKEGD